MGKGARADGSGRGRVAAVLKWLTGAVWTQTCVSLRVLIESERDYDKDGARERARSAEECDFSLSRRPTSLFLLLATPCMSRQRTPPEQVQPSATEAHTASRKHQLRHRSPRGQRGRPRVGLVGAASPSSSSSAPPATNQDAAGGSGTTAPASGSTRHRQRDKAALVSRPQQHKWLLQMWSKYRKQVTIAAAVLVLVLIM